MSNKSAKQAFQQAEDLVLDLFKALREIKGKPTLKDLIKLAKRIRKEKRHCDE